SCSGRIDRVHLRTITDLVENTIFLTWYQSPYPVGHFLQHPVRRAVAKLRRQSFEKRWISDAHTVG
ncbi:MAG: hypothetical protein WB630_08910, partial [Candidatus Acidiferrales bacterium]